jgi:hypothetical protein
MFRFTIRDVLWLTVVVGMALAWWFQFQKTKEESLRRQAWEKSARSLARQSRRPVQLQDDGTIVIYPYESEIDKDTGKRIPKIRSASPEEE